MLSSRVDDISRPCRLSGKKNAPPPTHRPTARFAPFMTSFGWSDFVLFFLSQSAGPLHTKHYGIGVRSAQACSMMDALHRTAQDTLSFTQATSLSRGLREGLVPAGSPGLT